LLPTEFEKNLAYRFEFKEALKGTLDVHDVITRVIMLSKLEERYSQGMNQLDAVIDISKISTPRSTMEKIFRLFSFRAALATCFWLLFVTEDGWLHPNSISIG
jgi:hypothetical protein